MPDTVGSKRLELPRFGVEPPAMPEMLNHTMKLRLTDIIEQHQRENTYGVSISIWKLIYRVDMDMVRMLINLVSISIDFQRIW